jgi:hypothetical protein
MCVLQAAIYIVVLLAKARNTERTGKHSIFNLPIWGSLLKHFLPNLNKLVQGDQP